MADGQITPTMLAVVALYTAGRVYFMVRNKRRQKK